jgi:hypothetical protein
MKMPLCFVFGSPRSGTTFLGRLLGSHPKIAYLEETMFGCYLPDLRKGLTRLWEVKEKMKKKPCQEAFTDMAYTDLVTLSEEESRRNEAEVTREARKLFESIFRRHLAQTRRKVLLEKTPRHALYLDEIHALFPEALYIHLIRDGRDVLSSFIARDLFRHWHLDLNGREPVDVIAADWRRHVMQGRKFGARAGVRYLEWRYRDYIPQIRESVIPLLRVFGLSWAPEMDVFLEHGMGGLDRGRIGQYRKVLTAEQIERFEKINADLLVELGYPLETLFFNKEPAVHERNG